MSKPRRKFREVAVLCAVLTMLGVLAWSAKNALSEPKARHQQQQDGIVAQVERVSIERIFNEPGALEYSDPHWRTKDISHPGESWRSFRFLRIFISFHGAVETIASIEQPKVEFATETTGNEEGIAGFSPPMVARRLWGITVDPKAMGREFWVHLGKDDDPWKMFPVSIEQTVKLKNGEILSFSFKNVEF